MHASENQKEQKEWGKSKRDGEKAKRMDAVGIEPTTFHRHFDMRSDCETVRGEGK